MDTGAIVGDLKAHENYELLAFLFYLVGHAAELDITTPLGALKAGQLARSTRAMALDFKLSKSTVARRLKALKGLGLVTVEGFGFRYRITLCNWDAYRKKAAKPSEAPAPKARAEKKAPQFSDESTEMRLATLLFKFIRLRIPTAKPPNLQAWAYDADLLLRVDARTPDEVEKVIRYSQKNTFWQRNILSIDKLRKHFDRLTLEIRNDGPQGYASDLPAESTRAPARWASATDKRERRFHEVVSKYS